LARSLEKRFRQAFHDLGNQLVRFPHSLFRVIDKTDLDGIPVSAKILGRIRQEKRGELLVFACFSASTMPAIYLPT